MVNKRNRTTFERVSRKDLSNPFHRLTHEELLRKAGIGKFVEQPDVNRLANGRISISEGRGRNKRSSKRVRSD